MLQEMHGPFYLKHYDGLHGAIPVSIKSELDVSIFFFFHVSSKQGDSKYENNVTKSSQP